MLIAQITDCHVKREGRLVYGKIDSATMLERAILRINALNPQPDVVIATGDLADGGEPAEYLRLRKLLTRLRARFLLLPGNHDRRAALREAFPDHPYLAGPGGFCCYADESGPVRLVAHDSSEDGKVGAVFDAPRLAWLEQTLGARPHAPTLVFTHHPPFVTAIAHIDAFAAVGAGEFAAVIGRHRQVVRVIAGHVHRAMSVAWAGTICTTCPSTAHQFALDLAPGVPAYWTDEPSGYQLHHWLAGTGLVTHTAFTMPSTRNRLA